jgi:proline iminopeptidase
MRTAFATIILTLGLVLGVVASGPVFIASASVINRPSLLLAVSAVCMMVIVAVAAWAGLLVARARRPAARAIALGIGSGALLFAALSLLLLRPPARTLLDPIPGPDIRYWQLPTGSRIAYLKSAAAGEHRATPVIMLHGGPGGPVLPLFQLLKTPRPLDGLTTVGYDVYYYDQLGGGFSSRLDLRRDAPYTVARHVADLEAIRMAIGADQIILVGHSWGAILAARYMLEHPGRVAKVVFDSPGALTGLPGGNPAAEPPMSSEDRARLERVQQPTLRITTGRDLAAKNSRAAFYFIPDWEVDQWFARQTAEELRLQHVRASCDASVNRSMAETWLSGRPGVGFFCNTQTVMDLIQLPDPRPKLRADSTPALVLRSECDFLPWPSALDYRKTFPNARLAPIGRAGHFIWVDQPAIYGRLIAAFLSDAPLPIADYAGDTAPW